MFCSNCGNEVQQDWSHCPKCGKNLTSTTNNKPNNANQKQSIPPEKGLAITIMAVLLFFGLAFMASSCRPTNLSSAPKSQQSAARQILCSANIESGIISIRNENDFDWNNVRITLVSGSTSYTLNGVGTIKKGGTGSFKTLEFVASNGERFNHLKYKPSKILVYADNASGGREFL